MGNLGEIKPFNASTDKLVRHGDSVVISKSEKGFVGRTIEWVLGNTNDCNILGCLTKSIEKAPLVKDDFEGFYSVQKEYKNHVRGPWDDLSLGHVVDAILGRGDVKGAFEKFDEVGHARLRELLYGTAEPHEDIDNGLIDKHYNIMKSTDQNAERRLSDCKTYEASLKANYNLEPSEIVKRYEKLADAGFPVAAWRLQQVYQQGIFGQTIDLKKADMYATQAEKAGLAPKMDTTFEYTNVTEDLFGKNVSFPEAEVDKFNQILRGGNLSVDSFKEYEQKLTSLHHSPSDIVSRYEELANKGYSGAAWRLVPIHGQGLFGQAPSLDKVNHYSSQHGPYTWLRAALFGSSEEQVKAAAQVETPALDFLYEVFRGPQIGQQNCEAFEEGLREYGLSDQDIVGRYHDMAASNLPGAAWRLYQIYSEGLLGATKDLGLASKYSLQAREAGLEITPTTRRQGGVFY